MRRWVKRKNAVRCGFLVAYVWLQDFPPKYWDFFPLYSTKVIFLHYTKKDLLLNRFCFHEESHALKNTKVTQLKLTKLFIFLMCWTEVRFILVFDDTKDQEIIFESLTWMGYKSYTEETVNRNIDPGGPWLTWYSKYKNIDMRLYLKNLIKL